MTTTALTLSLAEMDRLPLSELVAYGRKAGIIPADVRDDAAAYGIILKARELGIPPMAAFSSIYFIAGRPTCSAQLMLALARKAAGPLLKYEIKGDAEKCVGKMSTDGGATWNEVAWTFAMAQKAGYTGKSNWKSTPDAMLRARVISALVRLCVPEATLGIYTREEIEDVRDAAATASTVTPAKMAEARLLGTEVPAEPAPVPVETPAPVGSDAMAEADWKAAIAQCDAADLLKEHATVIAGDSRIDDAARSRLGDAIREKARASGWSKPRAREPGED